HEAADARARGGDGPALGAHVDEVGRGEGHSRTSVALPSTRRSPLSVSVCTSQSTSFRPFSSYLRVTTPRQVIVSPGQVILVKRTLKRLTLPAPALSTSIWARKPMLNMPCANTLLYPDCCANSSSVWMGLASIAA